jgi:class 3 adenylate cyclase/tetratricopeptide (TPR) repeat protein
LETEEQTSELKNPDSLSGGTAEARVFLIADVRGYSRFTSERGDEAAARLATKFAGIGRDVVTRNGGALLEVRGDEILAVFISARHALRAATDLRTSFLTETRSDPSLPLHAGIGLDAGEAVPVDGGFRGAALNRAARLCSLAGPEEVLATDAVVHLAGKLEGLAYHDRGGLELKGFDQPVRVVEVVQKLDEEQPDSRPESIRLEVEVAQRSLPIGGFLGALPSSSIVGRDEELASLLSAVDAVAAGSGRLLLLAGEPGVGKTRLAQEATIALRNRGFLIATGRCYEPQQGVAFYPFLEALSAAYRSAPSAIQAKVSQTWPHLAQLLPDDLPADAIAMTRDQFDEQRLYRAVTGFLHAVSQSIPLALLLDDLHWADQSSVQLLQYLARHTRNDPILLLATYRDVEVGRSHPLRQALRDLNREHLIERIVVRRLGQAETSVLLATLLNEDQVSDEFAELVYRTTEGNPFFTDEVLRGLIERGDVFRREGVWDRRDISEIEVPESVRDAIGERLGHLDEEVQDVLAEASVLGQSFAFDDLLSLGDRSEDDVEQALETASEGGLVRSVGADEYAFNHVLTQQTLYEELTARRRRRLHLAAGEALERLPVRRREPRVAEIAWHFLQGGDGARALPHALAAGDQAERRFAHVEGEQHYRSAVDLSRETGDPANEALALERLAAVTRTQSHHQEALDLLEAAALLLADAGDEEGEIRVTAQIGLTYAERGSTNEGIDRVQRLLERLSDPKPSSALAALYTALARLHYFGIQHRQSLIAADKAVALAREVNDERILVQAEVRRGAALYIMGKLDEALPVAHAAQSMANQLGDRESACRALHTISGVYMVKGDFLEAERFRRLMLLVAEEIGDPNQIAFATAYLGLILTYRGVWREARDVLRNFAAMGERLGTTWYSTYGSAFLAYLDFMQGDAANASALKDAATSSGAHRSDPFIQALWAEQEILLGDPQSAIQRLRASFAADEVYMPDVIALAVLAWAEMEAGLPSAEETARRGVSLTAEFPHVPHRAEALRLLAMVLRESGKLDESETTFAEAVDLAASLPYPFAEARARYEWAKLLVIRNEKERARAELEQALRIFQALGAEPDCGRSREALMRLGED